MQPEMGLVERALERLAREWGRPVDETVAGVIALAQTKMANAVKLVSVKRGYDPRDFTLVAFGGGGPLHACAVADVLGIDQVVVPRHPSVFSAIGMLFADVREDTVATWGVHVTVDIPAELTRRLAALEADAMTRLTELGVDQRSVSVEYSLDMRYVGQEHAVSVPIPRPDVPYEDLTSLFEAEHLRSYRFTTQDEVEVVHLRVVAWASVGEAEAAGAVSTVGPVGAPGMRSILVDGERTPARVYWRDKIHGQRIAGPAVIEESGTATIVLPGWSARAEATGDVRLTREVGVDGQQ